MPDYSPSAADADAEVNVVGSTAAARPLVTPTTPTPTTPTSPFSGSFYTRPSPGNNLSRSFNLHALGFGTSPLGPLGRRISFYGGDSDDEEDAEEGGNGHLEDYSNDSSINGDLNRRDWHTGNGDDIDDGVNENGYGLDDPIALEDRKDVLIDRLNDVVRHVTSYAPSSPSLSNRSASTWNSPAKSASAEAGGPTTTVDDGTVLSALHAHIDEMEAVLAAAQAAEAAAAAASPRNNRHHHHRHYPWQRPERRSHASPPSVASEKSPGIIQMAKTTRRTTLDAAPILLRNQSSSLHATAPASPKTPNRAVNSQRAAVSNDVVEGCDALAGDLSAVLVNLLKRRQESETIQETLLQQLAAANSRTAELEAQVKALTEARGNNNCDGNDDDDEESKTETATEKGANDDTADDRLADRLADLDDLGSELSFLRLQLRGIEVRCRSYVPVDTDPELTESIENWKADWSALRAKVGEERRSTTNSMNISMSLLDDNNSNSMNDMNSTF